MMLTPKIILLGTTIFLCSTNLLQAHQVVDTTLTEVRSISGNMAHHHPYLMGLAITWLVRYATYNAPESDCRNFICRMFGFDKETWWLKALVVGACIDVYANKHNALPHQAATALRDLFKSYSASSNNDFLKKSNKWINAQWKHLKRMMKS